MGLLPGLCQAANHLEMDEFLFDKLPPTSLSTPRSRHKTSQMDQDEGLGSGTDHDSTADSFSMVLDDTHSQQTNSKIDDISKKVEDLVGKINDSRTMDQQMMDTFQDKLAEKVTVVARQMKEHMYTCYEENSQAMHVKLQELSKVLESCTKLSAELHNASQALASLNKDLTQVPEQ